MCSVTVIHRLKNHLYLHGILEVLIHSLLQMSLPTSCGSGGSSTSEQPQEARKLEAAVKAIKTMMIKCRKRYDDPYIGLLRLFNTPTEGLTTSPDQCLVDRHTQTIIPATDNAPKNASRIPLSESMKMACKKFRI